MRRKLLQLDNVWQENRSVWRLLYDPWDEVHEIDPISIRSRLKENSRMQEICRSRADSALKRFRESKLKAAMLHLELIYLNDLATTSQ